MNVKQALTKLQILNSDLAKLKASRDKLTNSIETEIKTRFDTAWKKSFPCFTYCGYVENGGIYIREILHNASMQRARALENKQWGEQDLDDDYGYGLPIHFALDHQVFQNFIESFKHDNPDIVVHTISLKIRLGVNPNEISTFTHLKHLYSGKEVLLTNKGDKWYMGWDIPDRWMIISVDGIKEAWRQTGAHGGYMEFAGKEDSVEYESFLSWIDE